MAQKKKTPKQQSPVPPAEPLPPTPAVSSVTPAKPKIITDTPTSKTSAAQPAKKSKVGLWVGISVSIVVLGAAAAVGWMVFGEPNTTPMTNTTNSVSNLNTNVPVLVARPLDGKLVSAAEQKPQLSAVMIENLTDSRPPSGLDKASVVYEALAEGGITRFMAIFTPDQSIKEIGPVRSARPYYVSYAQAYYPFYVHAGGSPQALSILAQSSTKVIDFNQFSNGQYFVRDRTRFAPHNLYTSSDKLTFAIRDKKKPNASDPTAWNFQEEPSIDVRPLVTKDIVINYSSLNYRVTYTYDRVLNQYSRKHGTKAHVTRDGKQIVTNNVVVMYVQTGLYPNETQRLKMTTVGSGKAIVFNNGAATVGTWKKTSDSSREQFYDADGKLIPLNSGITWISVVPVDRSVTY